MTDTPRTRLTRGQSQEQTRQRLIEAACRHVAERGFNAASVRDIAEAAGYSQGAFYSNFKSKEALLLDLLQQHKVAEAERIRTIVDGAGEDFGAALAGLEKWANGFGMSPEQAMLAAELQLHAARNSEFGAAYEVLMAEQRDAYAALIARLFALRGIAPPSSPQELAGGLMALARGVAIDSALQGRSAGSMLASFLRVLFQQPTGCG